MIRLIQQSGVLVVLAVFLGVAVASSGAWAKEDSTAGKVIDVTLYRGQAMITRQIPLQGEAGSREVVVSDLPEFVVPESLFAEGNDQVEVRAVRYRTRAVSEAPREEIRKLDEQIKAVTRKIQVNQKTKQLLEKQIQYLNQMEGFVAPTAKMELSKGVLNATALEKITKFSFDEREKILDRQVTTDVEASELAEQLNLLNRKRSELTDGKTRTVREAVVFLEKRGGGASSIELSYLVGNCGWSPSYTLRANGAGDQVAVECNALIHQMTGESWQGVHLTLSTASPVLNADSPGLAPFPVTLVARSPVPPASITSPGVEGLGQNQPQDGQSSLLAAQSRDFLDRKQQATKEYLAAAEPALTFGQSASPANKLGSRVASGAEAKAPPSRRHDANWEMNSLINELQCMELEVAGKRLSEIMGGRMGAEEGPSLVYPFDEPVSIASRRDQQMVRILQTTLASTVRHIATPLLTSYVYRQAEITNTSDIDLLAGPVTAYLHGQFVGRTTMPTVARGQTFVVGFGADPQLRARRELVDKSESLQGGNRELEFSYRLAIENSKSEPVKVSVIDRLPHTERPNDIRVALGKMSDKLSDDKLYVLREKPQGILRWDVEVPADSAGAAARMVEFHFTVDFDRNFQLTALRENIEKQRREFEELQMERGLQR